MASITLHELHSFHEIDREVFRRLVINLERDAGESLLVMATWMWLEQFGFPNIIVKMVKLSDNFVDGLASEAMLCLNSLKSHDLLHVPSDGGLPLTTTITEKSISLQLFQQNKFSAITGIKNFLNKVCTRIFTDILEPVLGSLTQVILDQPLVVPGFPDPIFGEVIIVPRAIDYDFPTGDLWGWDAYNNASEDDRTMFLTFSRGFPVSGDEVKELFTRMLGDCVESVHLQENANCIEQPLFARLVLHSVKNVDQVLNGRKISKFRINGKHIWARKYERRDQISCISNDTCIGYSMSAT